MIVWTGFSPTYGSRRSTSKLRFAVGPSSKRPPQRYPRPDSLSSVTAPKGVTKPRPPKVEKPYSTLSSSRRSGWPPEEPARGESCSHSRRTPLPVRPQLWLRFAESPAPDGSGSIEKEAPKPHSLGRAPSAINWRPKPSTIQPFPGVVEAYAAAQLDPGPCLSVAAFGAEAKFAPGRNRSAEGEGVLVGSLGREP